MSAGNTKTPPAPRLPLFGVEIELFVKVKPKVEVLTWKKRHANPDSVPEYWRNWDFDLKNNPPDRDAQIKVIYQRREVGRAIQADIDAMLGPKNGWHCEPDPSLSERMLTLPIDPRKWWGVELVSPPMSVSKQWQQEIEMVYKAVCKNFDIWTSDFCGCHVHVSPGPVKTKENDYSVAKLVRMAKTSYFWEKALCEFLPPDRRESTYARPNYKSFATKEYEEVERAGWGPVFDKLDDLAAGRRGQSNFLHEIQGGLIEGDRYTSFNFEAFMDIGTVEFRRQAGVLSPITTAHRILLALGLHLSAMRYDFDGAKARTTHPTAEELRKELAGCIKKLPETCHGTRFLNFLTWCQESYKGGKRFTEEQINEREQALRKGQTPPEQRSAVPPRPPAENSQETTASQPRGRAPAASSPAAAAPAQSSSAGRGGARDTAPTGRQTPAAGRGGAAAGRGGAAQGAAGRGASQGTAGRGAPQGTAGRGGSAPTTTPRTSTSTNTGTGTARTTGPQGTSTPARTSTTNSRDTAPTTNQSTGTSRPRASGGTASNANASSTSYGYDAVEELVLEENMKGGGTFNGVGSLT
ncbi:putative amidoligase enzyme-domain-containing protein [Chaetomium tenue]|uniref:Amidoligase enzyme-domain-containing protein n=1 Tax=Chaetomium tenue TaxID=1854479 RepID=A0ACB7P978_9PEZI|nr:putative amidoligase enzyme-domain-containing protein [Chaetomium globosum]